MKVSFVIGEEDIQGGGGRRRLFCSLWVNVAEAQPICREGANRFCRQVGIRPQMEGGTAVEFSAPGRFVAYEV